MIFLGVIIFLHTAILKQLIFFPYPELFVYPYLTNQGLLPYKEIMDQHFPGLMFLPINLDKLGMTTPEEARLWQLGIVLITHFLLFITARKFVDSDKKALLVNFFYFIFHPVLEGWVLWIDSFLPLFLLPALYFLKNKKLFLAGIFIGIAIVFKQVVLPLAFVTLLIIYLKDRNIKNALRFLSGMLIPCLLLLFYILKLGVLEDLVYWTVTFNLTTFAQMGRKYPELKELVKLLALFLPTLFVLKKDKFLSVFFLLSLLFAYARFDLVHLQPALPFACILLVIFLSKFQKVIKWLLIPYGIILMIITIIFYNSHIGNKIFFFGNLEKNLASKIQQLTTKEDKIFAAGTTPHIYQLSGRLPAGDVFVFQFPWFMVKAEDKVLSGLINDQPKVIIRDRSAIVAGENLLNYMPKINSYIDNYYQVVDWENGVEILTRK